MKRLFLLSFWTIIFFSYLFVGHSDATDETDIYTGDWRNGYSFTDTEQSHSYNLHGYVQGVIDGLKYAKLIPDDVSRLDAFDALTGFYLNNPNERQRPIIEVLLEKYKSK